jgi:adenine-specific DNA-methyltransferase
MIMRGMSDILEDERLALQSELDAEKTQAERNRLGQFGTPTFLAVEILKYASTLLPKNQKVHFFDPAVGTGAFFSALRKVFPEKRIVEAIGFEIDPQYAKPASRFWAKLGFTIKLADFTEEEPSARFNLLICNPPYVRHHHLNSEDKNRLQLRNRNASGMNLNGLAGLYCHFLGLSHPWMAEGGIAGWLIPSEFMDVNYGLALKRYLLHQTTLLHIHRFDPNDVQFSDALVSSAIVWFKKSVPPKEHTVKFTYGGTLLKPKLSREIPAKVLVHEPKWSRFPATNIRPKKRCTILSDFFQIKRGVATGDNKFFILDSKQILVHRLPMQVFCPILPSPRYLPKDQVASDMNGLPLIKRQLFLLNTQLPEDEVKVRFPPLFIYLQEGKSRGIHQRYLCRHRSPWYSQEYRPPAPIVCTYLGRSDTKSGRPFRFILNNSIATVANVYLAMYPMANLVRAMNRDHTLTHRIWKVLNGITPDKLLGEGRVYGGGLHKLEPSELGNVDATAIAELIPDIEVTPRAEQLELFDESTAQIALLQK